MVTEPVKRKAFEAPEQSLEHLSSTEGRELVGEIQTLRRQVVGLVAKLGISGECTGFIADEHLAMSWKKWREEKPVSYFRRLPFVETMFNGNSRVLLNFCPRSSSRPQFWAFRTRTPP